MHKGEAWAMSDGSYTKVAGAAAWTIEGSNQEGRCTGMSLRPGDVQHQSAFRSKLAGIYQYCWYLRTHDGKMGRWWPTLKIGCDGKSAVDMLNLKNNQTNRSSLQHPSSYPKPPRNTTPTCQRTSRHRFTNCTLERGMDKYWNGRECKEKSKYI